MFHLQNWRVVLVVPSLAVLAACGGGSGGKDAGTNCDATQIECSGSCVNSLSDPLNCGACGNACGTGTQCLSGVCSATCGDGVAGGGEGCDDGNTTAGDGCDATCEVEMGWACMGAPSVCTPGCGDGALVGMEVCDDGNTTSGDGCSEACALETGFTCTGEPSVCVTTCGDAIIAGAETCDDQNTMAGDGCSDTCVVEAGYTCAGSPSVCATTCGDGVPAGTETCDDGNTTAGDGCDDMCAPEAGFTCNGTPSNCFTTCNDGIVAGNETCDDQNTAEGDGCDASCTVETGFTCTGMPSVCSTVCGDGVTAGAETCDDGNATAMDGCSDTCIIEPGFTCTGAPSTCTTTCGDGIVAGAEGCDDSNTTASDGCSATCVVEAGYACMGSPSACAGVCGDGMVVGTEACDDANTTAGDGCSDVCAAEAGFTCIGAPSTCTTTCGDGVRAGAEGCDDGNVVASDGCSATCAAEGGYSCTGTPSVCTQVLVCPSGSTVVSHTSTDVPKTLDDVTPTNSSVIAVTAAGYVSAAVVEMTLPHEYVGDMDVSLVAPGGGTVDLTSGNGSNGVDYIGTIFTDSATTSITAGMAPFTGSFKPEVPLSTLAGVATAGNWTLSLVDTYPTLDDGSLTDYRLHLCVCTNCEVGALCGDGTDNDGDTQIDCADSDCSSAAACSCGNGVLDFGEACDDGNSAGGDGCSSSCNPELGFTCTGTPSVCAPALACGTNSTFSAFSASNLPQPVGPTNVQSPIAVSAPGVVTNAAVRVTIPHTYVEDLELSLLSPTSTSVNLSSGNGGSSDDYIDTLFTDGAATSITTATAPFTGAYQPESPLSAVAGSFATGTWTLDVVDAYPSDDDGTVQKYELMLCICATCEIGAACADMVDNDSDGQVDCLDVDCSAAPNCP